MLAQKKQKEKDMKQKVKSLSSKYDEVEKRIQKQREEQRVILAKKKVSEQLKAAELRENIQINKSIMK